MIFPGRYTNGKRFFPLGFYIASTILYKNGYNVKCLDLTFHKDYKFTILQHIQNCKPDILGFSICSSSNYKFAIDLIKDLRLSKQFPILFGGQHMQPPTQRENDMYSAIEGDLEKVKFFYDRHLICHDIENVDYSLIPHTYIRNYYPSIEISRGCWNHCQFCNSDNRHIEKDIKSIESDLRGLTNIYPQGTLLTIAGSNHIIKNWRKKGILDILYEYSNYFRLNFNLGIESGWEDEWENIKKLNLWNIFVGIESCDEKTLFRMQKSKTPRVYLRKASDFLSRCKTDGIYAFASYIYGYPGQSIQDLDNLDEFLLNHSCENIVQIGFPCEAYPGTALLLNRRFYEQLGVKYNEVYEGDNIEYYRLDISQELRYEYLLKRSNLMQNITNTKDVYKLNRCKGRDVE